MAGGIQGITIDIGGNTTGLNKALQEPIRISKSLQTELKAVDKGLKFDSKNIVLTTQKQDILTKSLEETAKKLDILKQAKDKVYKASANNAAWEKEFIPLKKEIDETAKKMTDLARQSEEMKRKLSSGEISQSQYDKYQKKLADVTDEHKNLMRSKSDLEKKFADGHLDDEGLRKYERQLEEVQAEEKRLRDELDKTTNKLRIHATEWQTAGDKLIDVGGKMSGVGSKLTAGLTVPLVGGGAAVTTFAFQAENSFAKVGTIIDETAVSYDELQSGVTKASNDTGIAITDFNEVLYQSISAGVDSGKSIGFTTDMVKLAKGGFTGTSEAVDVVTTALNAYGLTTENATQISDKLITTQNLGKTTVDELSSSLGKVIPTAKNVNVDFDNVSAAMATLTKNGIKTAEATTYYNAMLNELGKSGSTADEVLRELSGKGFAELTAQGVPVTDTLKMLTDYAGESGKSLADMFGSAEASKAALTIMKNDGAEYNDMLKAMENSAGATQKAYDKMNDTDLEKFKKELNKMKNAGIEAGQKLIPIVTKGITAISDLTDKFAALPPKQQESIVKMAGFVAATGPVIKLTGNLTSGIGSTVKGLGKMAEGLGKTGTAVKGLGGFFSAITSPAGLAVVAVGAVTAGVAALYIESTKQSQAEIDFAKSQENLSEKLNNGAQAAAAWKDGISSAHGVLQEFNMETIFSAESQQAIETGISEAQANILTIAQTAAAESRRLTDEERIQIEELVGLINDYTAKKVEAYIQQQEIVMEMAKREQDMTSENAQNILKSAEDTKNQTIAIAETKRQGLYGLAIEEFNDGQGLTQAEYDAKLAAADAQYNLEISSAEKTANDTQAIVTNGYAKHLEQTNSFNTAYSDTLTKMRDTQKAHDDGLLKLADDLATKVKDGELNALQALTDYNEELETRSDQHNTNMDAIWGNYSNNLTQAQITDAQTLMQMVVDSENNGTQLDATTQNMVTSLLTTFSSLDTDARKDLNAAFEGMGLEINAGGELIYTSGENAGKKVVEGFNSENIPEEIKGVGKDIVNQFGESLNGDDESLRQKGRQKINAAADGMKSEATAQSATIGQNADLIMKPLSVGITNYDLATPTKTKLGEISNVFNDPNLVLVTNENGVGVLMPMVNGMNSVDLATPASIKSEEASNAVINASANAGGSVQGSGSLLLSSFNSGVSGVNTLAPAQLKGAESGLGLIGGANSQNGGVLTAGTRLTSTINTAVGGIDTRGTGLRKGLDAGYGMTSGMDMQNTSVHSAGSNLAEQGVSGVNSVDSNSGYTWGSDLGENIANGLRSAWRSVVNAASSLADGISSYLHHSVPDKGALSDDDEWMPDMMQNFVRGIDGGSGNVIRSAKNLAGKMKSVLDMESELGISDSLIRADLIGYGGYGSVTNTTNNSQPTVNLNIAEVTGSDEIAVKQLAREVAFHMREMQLQEKRGVNH